MSQYTQAVVIDPEFIIIGDQLFTTWPASKDLNPRFRKSVSKDYVSMQDGVIARTEKSDPYNNSRISTIDILVAQENGRLPIHFAEAVGWKIDEMPISPIYIGKEKKVFDPLMNGEEFNKMINEPGMINRKFHIIASHYYGRINSIRIEEYQATNYYNDAKTSNDRGDKDKFVEKGFKEAAGKSLFNIFVFAITSLFVVAVVAGLLFWLYLKLQ